MEPLIKGPAGLDYLRNAFVNRYGSPSDASTSLPSTLRWLLSIWTCKDEEWEEHLTSALEGSDSSSQGWLPSATLRTGGNVLVKGSSIQTPFTTDGAITIGLKLRELFLSPDCVTYVNRHLPLQVLRLTPACMQFCSGNQQPECKGERVDLVVRLGLLKLVSGISSLTQEDLPETLFLNFSRLRSVQAQFQKIIVTSTRQDWHDIFFKTLSQFYIG